MRFTSRNLQNFYKIKGKCNLQLFESKGVSIGPIASNYILLSIIWPCIPNLPMPQLNRLPEEFKIIENSNPQET